MILDTVSYVALRSYLYERLDQQVEAAVAPATRALIARAEGVAPPGFSVPPSDLDLPESGGPGGPGSQLPPGTYAELRDSAGGTIARTRFGFGDEEVPVPELAADPQPSSVLEPEVFEVSAEGDSTVDFRGAAIALPNDTTVLVALPATEVGETLGRLLLIEVVVSALILIALAALALWVVKVGLRPLARMEETARGIAAGDLSRRVPDTDERTEVGRLGATLNEMLRQIEAAFAEREASEGRLRRFLADASHELRTPLSSIRGYAELFRLGAVADSAQLEKALGRIEAESTRMGELVEGMMVLARSDELRERPHSPLDLGKLAREACDDARAQAPDRAIGFRGERPAPVAGDEAQLRQVLGNLLGNAIAHTPAGTPIEVSVAVEDEEVRLEVRDHGPGIPAGSEELVFERFWRRDESRASEGSGLGLAIVAAIVAAHDGRVEAANVPGGGASFIVRLERSSSASLT